MPVIDEVANDYVDEVVFLAVAGRGDLETTRTRAGELFSDNLIWGLDDSIWNLYGVRGQPATVLIANGVVVDMWFGQLAAPEMRGRIDTLIALSS